MYRLFAIVMMFGLAGCLTATDAVVYRWPVDFALDSSAVMKSAAPKYGVVRLMQLNVRSPYDTESLAVLREDGTIAADPFNEFAALPATLFKGAAMDALTASGCFAQVVPASSIASARYAAEFEFTRLCLDCREPDARRVICEVRLRLLEDRNIRQLVVGEGEADAADGDYGKAFSKAVSVALASAITRLD